MRFIILFLISLQSLAAFQYELAICAIFQNEARFLSEWIDYHKKVGVQHFYLFNNCSDDNFQEALAPYIETGEVSLIDWPYRYEDGDISRWNLIQCNAYSEGLKRSKGVAHWLALIDTDEFIIPVRTRTLPETLQFFEAVPAVGVNWQMYGTSYVPEIPFGERMTESLLMRAVDDAPEHFVIKSIVQPLKTSLHVINPHFFSFLKGVCVNTNGEEIKGAIAPYIVTNVLRINHYWCRDEKFMREQKIPRRHHALKENEKDILKINDRYNMVHDDVILNKW
ncbi:hypothetical protein PHSC3_000893 [Chlamydiales bacterium STE3]|nr:hypothetical protein PHSC3_000893 [Chlamydiales bacterium STE3]